MTRRCCEEFTRAQLLRGGAAEAGRGLPAIEPGMPEPAGTGLTRRRLLSRSAGLALAVYGATKIPLAAFEPGIAAAAQPDKILVSVYFEGGIDAMSVLAPVGDPRYAKLRPHLRERRGAGPTFTEDHRLMWHPQAAPLAKLHAEGKVATFPAIGYSHPDESHFVSRHYYEIGQTDIHEKAGWLGRYIDLAGDEENPLQGLSLDGILSPTIATQHKPVAAISSVDSFEMRSRAGAPFEADLHESFARFGSLPSDSSALLQVRQAAAETERVRAELGPPTTFTSPVPYPGTEFAHKLAGLADYIERGLPMKVVTIRAAGHYDTHASQAPELAGGLGETCAGILAFQRDLEARGLDDRVMIEMWSEFGRRPAENGSGGTDHGAAGCAFVIGSRSAGRMVGEFPGLGKLDANENVRSTSDFRAMYCSLLEQWLGFDAARVIPGASGYARPHLVQG
jgi:uncharacterized protein (DUF1501 family)